MDKMTTDQLKEEIVRSLDIVTFYESHCGDGQDFGGGRQNGWTSKRVLCPLHSDRNTPSFFVNAETGGFKCHACGKGGSIFDFWIIKSGLAPDDKTNFAKALVALADDAGVDIKHWKDKPALTPKTKSAQLKRKDADIIPKVNKADAMDIANAPIDTIVVDTFNKALRPEHFMYLLKNRGLKAPTIEKACIGWDKTWKVKSNDGQWTDGRYTIPVRNKKGEVRNVRGYSPQADASSKMMNLVTDRGSPAERRHGTPVRLYNLDRLIAENWDHVVICEGEFDCILLNQMFADAGLTTYGAVTGTHGVKSFAPEWMEYLFGKFVYICFDCDEEGKLSSHNVANKYFLKALEASKFSTVKIIDLPLEGTKDSKDLTDFFLKSELNTNDFLKIMEETPELICGGMDGDEATVEAEEVDNLVVALKNRKYIDKKVTVPITISGTTSKIFHAIRSYKIKKCPLLAGGECCHADAGTQTIPYGHALFIEACMQKESANLRSIAEIACAKGKKCTVEPITKVVMEEYYAHQVVERWRAEEDQDGRLQNSQELVQTPVYILQPEDNITIQPQNYMATGWIRTHPHTAIATLFVQEMVPMEEDWRQFDMARSDNREVMQALKDEFTVPEIMHDLVHGVTKIYDADHILLTVLLTYLSPLHYNFNGGRIRGWVNSAILGDSGTGKSATYTALSDWIELGDLFSALSGTRTGLLYAIKQKGGEWMISIGRYVQASCKIIAIDETQESTKEEIKRMAIAMDTGFLSIEQVASGGYHTQTRTIFLMNPKDANGEAATISDFVFGCEALRECFDPMFIRRLDLAVFSTGKHDYDFYNQKSEIDAEIRLTSKMLRSLVHWAWTRKIDQIHWSPEATDMCLEKTTELSDKYGYVDDIPLVNPQDFRLNLARLSTAYAVLDRSFTDDLMALNVEPEHVAAMAMFIDSIYSSPACLLHQKSNQNRKRKTLSDFDEIREVFEETIKQAKDSSNQFFRDGNHFCQILLLIEQLESVKKRDLQEQIDMRSRWLGSNIATLQGFNLITSGRWGYKKTKKFNLFMQRWRQDQEIADMLEGVFLNVGKASRRANTTESYTSSLPSKSSDDPFSDFDHSQEQDDPFN